jgi:hypothetical protein
MGGGMTLGIAIPHEFNVGGWLAGIALVLFGFVAWRIDHREQSRPVA